MSGRSPSLYSTFSFIAMQRHQTKNETKTLKNKIYNNISVIDIYTIKVHKKRYNIVVSKEKYIYVLQEVHRYFLLRV